jgi:hypothetical protein
VSTPAPNRSVDVVVGAAASVVDSTVGAAHHVGSVLRPAARWAMAPPLVPERVRPGRLLERAGRLGAERREAWSRELSARVDVLLPIVLAEFLRRGRVTELLVRYVDLDAVVAAVDLDAAAARLDVDTVVARADVDEVVRKVDVDAVAQRLDLDAVLDRLNLTAVVLERVDLELLVHEILARMDLVGLAEEIIDGVDLPEIIRESTGSMASDTVRGVRMQGIAADEAVGRAMDRLLLRRGRRGNGGPPPGPAISAQPDRSP